MIYLFDSMVAMVLHFSLHTASKLIAEGWLPLKLHHIHKYTAQIVIHH